MEQLISLLVAALFFPLVLTIGAVMLLAVLRSAVGQGAKPAQPSASQTLTVRQR